MKYIKQYQVRLIDNELTWVEIGSNGDKCKPTRAGKYINFDASGYQNGDFITIKDTIYTVVDNGFGRLTWGIEPSKMLVGINGCIGFHVKNYKDRETLYLSPYNSRVNICKQDIYKVAYEKFGERQQLIVLLEELAELSQAVTKRLRYGKDYNKENFVEELVGVGIMVEQFAQIEGVEQVQAVKLKKLARLEKLLINSKVLTNKASKWKKGAPRKDGEGYICIMEDGNIDIAYWRKPLGLCDPTGTEGWCNSDGYKFANKIVYWTKLPDRNFAV